MDGKGGGGDWLVDRFEGASCAEGWGRGGEETHLVYEGMRALI